MNEPEHWHIRIKTLPPAYATLGPHHRSWTHRFCVDSQDAAHHVIGHPPLIEADGPAVDVSANKLTKPVGTICDGHRRVSPLAPTATADEVRTLMDWLTTSMDRALVDVVAKARQAYHHAFAYPAMDPATSIARASFLAQAEVHRGFAIRMRALQVGPHLGHPNAEALRPDDGTAWLRVPVVDVDGRLGSCIVGTCSHLDPTTES